MTGPLKIAARLALAVVGACALFPACTSRQQPAASSAAQSQPEAKRFQLTGKVISIDKAGKRLTVDHEAVPGFMDAMTMSYPVKDAEELDGLSPGDRVTATVVSTQGMYWLEDVKAPR